jgi:Stage II sporulation protein M
MAGRRAYLIDDDGFLGITTRFWLDLLLAIAIIVVVEFVPVVYTSVNPIAAIVAGIVLLLPFVDEYRSRRLRRSMDVPKSDLTSKQRASTIPWSLVDRISLRGRTLRLTTSKSKIKIVLDRDDLPAIRTKAAAVLGPKFSETPDRPVIGLSPIAKFALLTLVLFALSQAIIIWASFSPFFAGEQARYSTAYNSMEQSIRNASVLQQFVAIFFNNVQVALLGVIPGLGSILNSLADYNTGRVIQIIALQNGISASAVLSLLYAFPHTWVEELSYPLAGALGLYAVFHWRRQSYAEFCSWKRRNTTKIAVGFIAVALVLAFAAFLEVTEPLIGSDASLLWPLVALCVVIVYSKLKSGIAGALV